MPPTAHHQGTWPATQACALRVEPAIFHLAGLHSNHWAPPAKATITILLVYHPVVLSSFTVLCNQPPEVCHLAKQKLWPVKQLPPPPSATILPFVSEFDNSGHLLTILVFLFTIPEQRLHYCPYYLLRKNKLYYKIIFTRGGNGWVWSQNKITQEKKYFRSVSRGSVIKHFWLCDTLCHLSN